MFNALKCNAMSETTNSNQALQIFENAQFGQIRTVGTSEQPLFCAADVCKALGYSNGRDAVARHCDEDDVVKHDTIDNLGRNQQTTFVNESGLYSLIMGSKLESAKEFKRWVTGEVLPSIRKQGGYMAARADETEEELMARAFIMAKATIDRQQQQLQEARQQLSIVSEINEQQERQLTEQKPKVLFADAVSTSKDCILVGDLAKVLTQNGYPIGQNRLFKELRARGFLCQRDGYKNQPAQRYVEMGLFEVKYGTHQNPDGTSIMLRTTKVTGKGLAYFVNYFLNQKKSA